ncbi:MAG: hypothetical protein PHE67_00480 [Campylobacterales bacterium]|nr:hypothetical protein [Campylobacterales bacterium]
MSTLEMYSISVSPSRRRIYVHKDGVKVYTLCIQAELKRISVESNTIKIWTNDALMRLYDLSSGELTGTKGHNGELPKSEKKLRRERYRSRLANTERNDSELQKAV